MDDFKVIKLGSGEKELRIFLLDVPIEQNAVGMVESERFSDRLALIVEDSPEEERNYSFASLAYIKDSPAGVVYMENWVYQGLKRRGNTEIMILLHELGHYGHHHRGTDAERINLVRAGKVSIMEEQADDFAAEYLGYRAAADGLEQLKQECEKRYVSERYDPEEVAVSLKELELRIMRLRELGKEASANDDFSGAL